MAKFYLRTKKVSGTAPLYVRIQKKGSNILLNTHIVVDIENWTKANMNAMNWRKYVGHKEGFEVNQKMMMVSDVIESCSARCMIDTKLIQQSIDDVVFSPIRKAEEERKEAEVAKAMMEMEKRNNNPMYVLDKFIAGIESGEIRNKGNLYSAESIISWINFRKVFGKFYEESPFDWEDLDKSLADKFVNFLYAEEYMPKTINTNITLFKALINYAYTIGVHNDQRMSKFIYKVRVNEKDKQTEISLSAKEVQALYDMKLEGREDKYRDVFLCGVYTCQRFRDYSSLKEDNFSITKNGTRVVRITEQHKTKNSVVIPILNNNLLEIARKYDFNIPKVSKLRLNFFIKKILKRLSETVPSLAEMLPTKLTMKDRAMESAGKRHFAYDNQGRALKHRYDMVSSHTARRTGITLLYLTEKFDTVQMMSISGHKVVKTFLEYIKLSQDEMADRIARKMEEAASSDGLF